MHGRSARGWGGASNNTVCHLSDTAPQGTVAVGPDRPATKDSAAHLVRWASVLTVLTACVFPVQDSTHAVFQCPAECLLWVALAGMDLHAGGVQVPSFLDDLIVGAGAHTSLVAVRRMIV